MKCPPFTLQSSTCYSFVKYLFGRLQNIAQYFCIDDFANEFSSNSVIDSCKVSVTIKEGNRVMTSSVCGEYGHCMKLENGDFKCSCIPGYTGKYCHQSKNLQLLLVEH